MEDEPFQHSIFIDAAPEVVFEYWTNADLLVRWIGERARLDPRPGGEFTIDFGERRMQGHYVALEPPRRLVIAWGRQGSRELPPSSSTLEVRFIRQDGGTRVEISHTGLPPSERRGHALGWQRYLASLKQAAGPDGATQTDLEP